jgi:hypothetical protein
MYELAVMFGLPANLKLCALNEHFLPLNVKAEKGLFTSQFNTKKTT